MFNDSLGVPSRAVEFNLSRKIQPMEMFKNMLLNRGPEDTISGRDQERSPTGTGWKRNQWILQIRCPIGRLLSIRGSALVGGLMPSMKRVTVFG